LPNNVSTVILIMFEFLLESFIGVYLRHDLNFSQHVDFVESVVATCNQRHYLLVHL